VSTALGSPVVEDQMVAPAEMTGGLKLAVANAVMLAGTRAASLGWLEGRGRFRLLAVPQEFDFASPFPRFFYGGRGGFRQLRGHYRLR
jgi:hypothetical protein